MRRPKLINKQAFKKKDGKCYFCDETDYDLLDVHRILEGANGGSYSKHNCLTVCCKCHRKITAGKIITHRKYLRSDGKYVLHYTDENGEEHFN